MREYKDELAHGDVFFILKTADVEYAVAEHNSCVNICEYTGKRTSNGKKNIRIVTSLPVPYSGNSGRYPIVFTNYYYNYLRNLPKDELISIIREQMEYDRKNKIKDEMCRDRDRFRYDDKIARELDAKIERVLNALIDYQGKRNKFFDELYKEFMSAEAETVLDKYKDI